MTKTAVLIDDDKDDHEFFLEAIHDIDNSLTCNCLLDGEEALKLLRENKKNLPDLIILDTNMPRVNGRQILVELKSDPSLQSIPVVMYSTFFSDRDNEEFAKLGAVHYLAKPSKFGDFQNSLKEILTSKW